MSTECLLESEVIHCLHDKDYLEAVNESREKNGLKPIDLVTLIIDNVDIVMDFPDLVDIFKENEALWSRVKEFLVSDDEIPEEDDTVSEEI